MTPQKAYSTLALLRTYCRWIPELNRRENDWSEPVERYMQWLQSFAALPEPLYTQIRAALLQQEILPSMRALWSAGEAADRDNVTLYNCAFTPIDNLRAFAEVLYVLMNGAGIGFSVERQFIDRLPVVAVPNGERKTVVVADSTEGWADALYETIVALYRGFDVDHDVSAVRPHGALLKTKGGRASGPEPLLRLFALCRTTLHAAAGRRILPIEAHDICCMIGDIVRVGGFRRAAEISFSDLDDTAMRHAKDWSGGATFPEIRYMANNSANYADIPGHDTFRAEWKQLRESGSGERGIFYLSPGKKAQRGTDQMRCNPCGEVLLRYRLADDPWTGAGGGGSFCNLSVAVMRPWDTVATFAEKVRLAAWIGTAQATRTHFPYLRPAWEQICNEDALIGVDIAGQADNPALATNEEALRQFNRIAVETNEEAAAFFGIRPAAAVTLGKPGGNSSAVIWCGNGFHNWYAPYFMRRIRLDAKDPLTWLLRDQGVDLVPDNGENPDSPSVLVASFPCKAPDGARFRNDETAIQSLERYALVMRSWCGIKGHNQSVTIYVKDHEWDEVGEWVFNHFDLITGLSFLPYDGGLYKLAPYEEITAEQYAAAVAAFPQIDFSHLDRYEQEDRGEGAQVLACAGGSCDIR